MTNNDFIQILKDENIEYSETEVSKNNVNLHGYLLKKDNYGIIVYDNQIKNFDKKEDVLWLCSNYLNYPDNNQLEALSKIFDWEFVKDKLKLCIQQRTNEDILKKTFLDLELYIRIELSKNSSIKLMEDIFKQYNISEQEIFDIAKNNIKSQVIYTSFKKFLYDNYGITDMEDIPLYILYRKDSCYYGAAGFTEKEIMRKICKDLKTNKIVIIPSSINECLIYPYENSYDCGIINQAIKEINSTFEDPTEILSDHCYIFDSELDTFLFSFNIC